MKFLIEQNKIRITIWSDKSVQTASGGGHGLNADDI